LRIKSHKSQHTNRNFGCKQDLARSFTFQCMITFSLNNKFVKMIQRLTMHRVLRETDFLILQIDSSFVSHVDSSYLNTDVCNLNHRKK